MATSKTILIVIAVAGMIGAVIFFAFLVKRPVTEISPDGLPVSPPLSFPGPPPTPPPGEITPSPGGATTPGGVPVNAFIPIKQPPAQISGSAFLPISSDQVTTLLVLSEAEKSSLSELISQLNLRDDSGNLLSPQQLFAGQDDLPLPVQKLLQAPGGPTITDITTMEELVRTQADTLSNKISQLQILSQSGDLASATELCTEIIADTKIFYSSWGVGVAPSALDQFASCGGGLGGQLPLQLPFGLPEL